MSQSTVVFRTQAGPEVGLGHLRRCLSLAAALQQLDVRCVFAVPEEPQALRCVSEVGCEVEALEHVTPGGASDLQGTLRVVNRHGSTTVIVDSYQIGADYLHALRQAALVVVALDDLAAMAFPGQLVINGGVHATDLSYRSASGDTTFLLGPHYALLAPAYWNGLPPRPHGVTVRHVLVTVGGADPHELMPKLLRMAESLPGDFVVSAVVGPFFHHRQLVADVARQAQRTIRLVETPASLAGVLESVDLTVTAGGQTLYELACVGCPSVAIQTADNQAAQLEAFERLGVVRVAGRAADPSMFEAVIRNVTALIHDPEGRARMSAAGRRLIDGRGAQRVAQAIAAGIRMRPATAPLLMNRPV